MAQPERLLTIENTSDAPITDLWGGDQYTFEPSKPVTLVFGVGMHFTGKHPELKVVEETSGIAPHVTYTELVVENRAATPLNLMWDGHPYHFEPGAQAHLASEVAEALMIQARADGGKLVIADTSEPETPAAQVTPEEAPAPKKSKKAKKAKPTE